MSSALTAWHDRCLEILTGLQGVQSEPKATCGDCVMCGGVARSGSPVTFIPDVKCCSHIPSIPNFLAGRELTGEGQESIRARIRRRAGVTPLGLSVTLADVRSIVAHQPEFGRSTAVMCPHFVPATSGCAIWQNRNAVCSTWFCQHERGAVSQRFWHAVRDLLIAAEERLAYRCLTESGLPDEHVSAVLDQRASVRAAIKEAEAGTSPAVDGEDDLQQWYSRMWGGWEGREEAWFAHCATLIDELAPDDIRSWMDGVRHLSEAVLTTAEDLHRASPLPDHFSFAPGSGSALDGDVLRLVGYSQFDPVSVPASALWPLRLLAASTAPPEELVGTGVLHQLWDYGVLASREEGDRQRVEHLAQ